MDEHQVAEIRAFNRFYTSVIGLLDKHYLNSGFSLAEVRIIYELHHHDGISASDLIALLHLDKGYLSRMLRQFEKLKLVEKRQSEADKRSFQLFLTEKGKQDFKKLNDASNRQILQLLEAKDQETRAELIGHMKRIKEILTQTASNE